jgi:uncharacterized protein (TIGR02246 family)
MCLTFGCQEGEEAAEAVNDVMTDVATVKGLTDIYDEAHNAGDAEKLVSLVYAEDAVRMPADQPMLVGKAAILEWYRTSFEQNDYDLDNIAVEAKVSGDLAFQRGIYTITVIPKDGGDTQSGGGYWVAVYERQPDEGWKTIWDIWVIDTSVTADAAGPFQGSVMSGSESADGEADTASIRKALDDWYAAYNAGDFETLASYYSEDAVTMSDDEPPVLSGRDEILAAFRQEMEQFDLHVNEGLVQDVRVSGDLGFARGVDTGTASPKDGGDPMEFNTKWVAIYERQADGSWLCICELANSNL